MKKNTPKDIEEYLPHSAESSQGKRKFGKYIPAKIEDKWQQSWEKQGIYKFHFQEEKVKYYNLVELPYPSGDLHLGHWFSFVCPDVHARYKRMNGFNVFFPNGFDAFGLPAENAAIKRNIHPRDWTLKNIETMKSQFATMGTMIDWSHEAITCLPEYYRWNQWIFLKMWEKGLAYRGKALSNWCPSCQTVLANEGIEAGLCWRCGSVVEQKEIEQWFLKITEYADTLLWDNTEEGELSNGVDWPKSVREGQNNWVGRSEGAIVKFIVKNLEDEIDVFTTRPDTLYGATFLVVAPEHPAISNLLNSKLSPRGEASKTQNSKLQEVRVYVENSKKKTQMDRKEQKEKTGVFSGLYAIHPLTKEEIPVWVADYVLWGYGTGAIMAVPAHDERDFAFAKKFDLPVKHVILGSLESQEVYVGNGKIVNSGEWNGIKVPQEINKVIEWLEKKGFAKRKTEYHLHDWSISRQRYWGTPVPMIHCEDCGVIPVPERDLPIELPYEVDYTPKGKPPLATAEDWMNVRCPKCGKKSRRDAETLDTFFDSSWYYYRYTNPHYEDALFDKLKVKELLPVDIYFGGAEHTLGHTLYARFFTKFFKDSGLVEFDEFAAKRIQHGIILGPDGNRMSKSKGNVVNPDDVVREYGADTVRLYLCFMMPYEATAPWSITAISGIYRFLKRVWELSEKLEVGSMKSDVSSEDLHLMHKTIKKVGDDLNNIKFNTAVACLMEWLNYLSRKDIVSNKEYETLLLLVAPFAPHMTEELWQKLEKSNDSSIHLESWPVYEDEHLIQDQITIVVQVNGKLRDTLQVLRSEAQDQKLVETKAIESERVKVFLEGKTVRKIIYVSNKLLNIVAS